MARTKSAKTRNGDGDTNKKSTRERNSVVIKPPHFQMAVVKIRGASPYVQCAFSEKAKNTMIETQLMGSQAKKGRKRDPKDFKALYEGAMHKSKGGWCGIPAPAFRNAMISACKTVGFKMTLAKLSVFVEADGFDKNDGMPLVKITKGNPHPHTAPVRLATGATDIRVRPMWDEGWEAKVRLRWDADQFSASDMMNLLSRVGLQVGVGEGRPDSRNSAGQGWGMFEIVG